MRYHKKTINTGEWHKSKHAYIQEETSLSKQIIDKLPLLKKVFLILLVLDVIGLISMVATLLPTFNQLAGYGQLMLGVISVMVAVIVAIQLFEILAKIFLIKSTSPTFSWTSDRKGYVAAAKLLLLFNLGEAVLNVLSAGGEGATLINQGYLYLRVLASVVEMIAAFFYLRAVKRR